jgi:hypothetical protein
MNTRDVTGAVKLLEDGSLLCACGAHIVCDLRRTTCYSCLLCGMEYVVHLGIVKAGQITDDEARATGRTTAMLYRAALYNGTRIAIVCANGQEMLRLGFALENILRSAGRENFETRFNSIHTPERTFEFLTPSSEVRGKRYDTVFIDHAAWELHTAATGELYKELKACIRR